MRRTSPPPGAPPQGAGGPPSLATPRVHGYVSPGHARGRQPQPYHPLAAGRTSRRPPPLAPPQVQAPRHPMRRLLTAGLLLSLSAPALAQEAAAWLTQPVG